MTIPFFIDEESMLQKARTLGAQPSSGDEAADAADRVAVAVYYVGAALAERLRPW